MELLAEGCTQKVIAARMRVSLRRVENLVSTTKLKYGAASCAQVVHMWEAASIKRAS